MKTLDQLGTAHTLKLRLSIVSLVPSQTELLYDLGQEDKIIGITKFCVHRTILDQLKA
jgi:ABC-type hemin transport system substrate-binding protein